MLRGEVLVYVVFPPLATDLNEFIFVTLLLIYVSHLEMIVHELFACCHLSASNS